MSSRKSRALVSRSAELAFAAPIVVAHRMTRMALASAAPSARDRKEFDRMAAEKTTAFNASWNAMAQQAFRANQQIGATLLRSLWKLPTRRAANALAAQWNGAALGVLAKGLEPVHRTTVANARRLARTKLR